MFGNFIVYLYIRMNASNCPWKQIMPSWRPSLLAIWARRRTYAGVRRHELWKISEAASMNEHSGGDPFQSKEKTKGRLLLTLAKPHIVLENRGRPQTAGGRGKKLACETPPRLLIAPREGNPRRRPAYASGNSIFQRTTYLYTSRKGISPYTIPNKTRPPKQLPS